jgi:uncharacterized iron-regulated protein
MGSTNFIHMMTTGICSQNTKTNNHANETKISNLQNEINIQKDLEGNYGHFEMRRLYRKFREMKQHVVTTGEVSTFVYNIIRILTNHLQMTTSRKDTQVVCQ